MGTEYGGEEALDAGSLSGLSWEKSVSVGEMVEPWLFSLAREMHVVTKSGEITERGGTEPGEGG